LHHLDGIVTVDTAVANLAGAMGVRSWLLDRFDTDWRYLETLKTPWYPTVMPIRQQVFGDWAPVIDGVIEKMHKLTLTTGLECRA
jgi:hypothetical protein